MSDDKKSIFFADRSFWRGSAEVAAGVLLFSGIKWGLEWIIPGARAATGTAVANSGATF